MEEGALLDNLHRLAEIPTVIVQGRYDVVCPIVTADEVVRSWPAQAKGRLEYVIVPDAGHAATEPGILKALVEATEKFKSRRPQPESRAAN
jgi:proline iminopeptidase